MSELGLLPLVVLAGGLAAGLFVALRLIDRGSAASSGRKDVDLRLADLRAQRDELYSKLRGNDGEVPEGEDRQQMELLAATVLQQLDQLEQEQPRPAPSLPSPRSSGEPRGWLVRHPLITGVALGGGLVGLVALLIFWAQGDARPEPFATPNSTAAGGAIDRGEPPLAPEIAQQVGTLRARVAEDPDDLDSRRALTELLLVHSQFFDAFGEAQAILSRRENDPLATYTVGVVRYTMGQAEDALDWLDRSIRADPSFSQASLVRGIVLLQLGDRDGAIVSWQNGLDAVGGEEPRLKRLLQQTREGKSAQEILETPPG